MCERRDKIHMVKSLTLNHYMSLLNLKLCSHIWSTNFNFRPPLHRTFWSVLVWTFTLGDLQGAGASGSTGLATNFFCHGQKRDYLRRASQCARGTTKNPCSIIPHAHQFNASLAITHIHTQFTAVTCVIRHGGWFPQWRILLVHLLMLMGCATLPHTLSTILCYTASVVSKQQVLQAIFKTHCFTEPQLCRLLAYTCMLRLKLNLADLLSAYYTSMFVTNTVTNWSMEFEPYWRLFYHLRCKQQRSTIDGIIVLT